MLMVIANKITTLLSSTIRDSITNGKTIRVQITNEATRFAQTRYSFQPFILRFSASQVTAKQTAKELINYIKNNVNFELDIVGCRESKVKCAANEIDILLFVKNSKSFAFLLDELNWPQSIDGQQYTFPSKPSIPSQLSIVVKNVSLRINIASFTDDLKNAYPSAENVIRLKNKNQTDIKLLKVEFKSVEERNTVLERRKIMVNYISYDVEQYLGQAKVLICTKCQGIGPFKRQCQQVNETCKVCGVSCHDIKQHQCSFVPKCIHCGSSHNSNDPKCPVVKSFRASLTRKLLSLPPTSSYSTDCPADFPRLASAQFASIRNTTTNLILLKLDVINKCVNKLNDNIEILARKTEQFEKFMADKIESDIQFDKRIQAL
ncbi:unnamed protein product [Didymodactylos carnosus]|uniref:Uncharacterized protein n=1 Tax=Didymodactylos carnosus TaxID=1234261 RepID=A0A814UAU9_9BILA|nr:unnamed protein product [Didymodactylos carnosus]CAF1172753.1 unnamed protein product [Didymodactylos carnosus]CAF3735313.1 unnamed protein product [Didymodactylos carnosus]CAF3936643.1 unnamed protein product [Didymodactylos carnosus]